MKEVWINRKNGSSAFFFPLPKDQRSSAASPFLTPWTRGCACLCGKISDTTGSWRFPVWTFMNFCIISSVRLVCDFSSKSSGLTTALENCPGAEKCQGGKDPTAVCELKRCNTQPFRIPAYKRAFGNCPRGQALALCLLPCGTIKSLPKLWDNIVEAKHISSGKKKKVLEVLQLPDWPVSAFQEDSWEPWLSSINQWLVGLFPLTLLMPELCIRNASSCAKAGASLVAQC